MYQGAIGSIPSQGTYGRQPINVSHIDVSLSISLSLREDLNDLNDPLPLSLKAMTHTNKTPEKVTSSTKIACVKMHSDLILTFYVYMKFE